MSECTFRNRRERVILSSEDILCPVRETVDLAEPSETTDAADVDLLDFVNFPDLLEVAE